MNQIKEWFYAIIVVGSLLVFIWLLFDWVRSGCETVNRFNQGSMVSSVLDGREGMIVRVRCQGYHVRFSSETLSQPNHILGSGGEIKKGFYSIEFMRPFEIEAVK